MDTAVGSEERCDGGAWHNYATLKDGFDALANASGYLDVTNRKAMALMAGQLGVDRDTVEKEMKAIDSDSNNLVSFAEFALWCDRHTVGVPLGIDVPDKREWRKGVPAYWTSLPPVEEEESPATSSTAPVAAHDFRPPPRRRRGDISAVEGEVQEDASELEEFLEAAKQFQWQIVWQIVRRHPYYVNMRPPSRTFAAIHQAAFEGNADALRHLVEECGADPHLPTKDGLTPAKVALVQGNAEAAKLLEQWTSELQRKKTKKGAEASYVALMEQANEIIEKAKWAKWDDMFELIKLHPTAQNMRPDFRIFCAIHQAAYHGDAEVLRRLVEGRADADTPSRDRRTAIQVARERANQAAASYLASLEPGGDQSASDERHAHAVIDAAKDGDWEKAFELLGDGPPGLVNVRPEVRRYSVLHQAAFHGDIEVLRRLIEDFKADVTKLSIDQQNALEIARAEGNDMAAKYLEACVPTILLDDDFVTYPEQRFVTLGESELGKFRELLDKTHKKTSNWTRDRDKASGKYVFLTPVPTGYELVGVRRNENPALWRMYQVSREITRMECQSGGVAFEPWEPLTAKGLDWAELGLCGEANEWLLLHSGLPEALSAVARAGFSMAKLGSGGTTGGGGLYGNGTYFADSITKADEYARRRVEEKGEFRGCRAVALVRVLGGRHFYTDQEVSQKDKPGFEKRVFEGHYHSTVGDRLRLKNTFREYVVYNSAATYLEFVLYYRRKGVPEMHQ